MSDPSVELLSTYLDEKLVEAYCGELMDLFGDSPAFIMAHGCYFENTTDEKRRAFMDSVKK